MKRIILKIEAEVVIEMMEGEKLSETMDKLYIDCLANNNEVQVMNYNITNYKKINSK
jgi:transcriptional regulator